MCKVSSCETPKMLSATLQGHLAGCTAFKRRHSNSYIASTLRTRCRECRAVPAAIAVAGPSHSLIKRHRSLLTCRAEERDIGGYTPASYISFSDDPSKQCHHRAEVVVDAPIDVCFAMWSDWTKLVDFMDLIGQIGLDNNTPEMALFQCFYRWRKLPILEIVFLLERATVQPNSSIAFRSVYGMPLAGNVGLQEQVDGKTKVELYFTHPIPNLLVQMQVGPFGVETHMMQILRDNMAAYKAKVEELAPADWQQAKQQVAARAQQQQQRQQQAKEPPPAKQQQQQQAKPQRLRAQQQVQPPLEQQQQQQPQQLQQAAAPAARKQRTSRRTSAAVEVPAAAAAAAPSAASKPRSRSGTSRRTASAAAAADAGSSSSSGSAGRRRTRTATGSTAAGDAGNGTGQQVDSAKPARRSTTSKRSASAREQ
ncbi:hypothetical protein COO60DRAFT_689041 [Scenedesmus sp. NREL 46B-D3]|nr:hypothetical protein COO60DRAFT_689041 [Scenedesmus sp. NREL 46B-D3]